MVNTQIVMKKTNQSWIANVEKYSNAMDIPAGLFTLSSKLIAIGLKKAAIESTRIKGTKFQSAMSMLNFYINRAGKKLSISDKKRLEKAKTELRKLFAEN